MSSQLIDPPVAVLDKQPSGVRPVPNCELDEQDAIFASFRPANLTWKKLDWIVLIWMAAMHLGCLAAPFFFTWKALGVTVVLHWLTASVGICLGYHRYLTHRAFKLKWPAEFPVLMCSAIAGEGPPLTWAATHRLHHQRSDLAGDPHSPLEGKWWSHILWLFVNRTPLQQDALFRRYVPDLVDRPLIQFFHRTHGLWPVVMGIGLFVLGGLPMLVWGLCVRMVVAYHSTWFVNSATHLWGYRNYETGDESRNLWWVALVSYGEGWHNNHHAHPTVAPAGHRWWEFDMTWWTIKALRFCGLATDVNDQIPAQTAKNANAA